MSRPSATRRASAASEALQQPCLCFFPSIEQLSAISEAVGDEHDADEEEERQRKAAEEGAPDLDE